MLKDLYLEIKSFLKGKIIDALVPPLLFVSLNSLFGLFIGLMGSISTSIFLLFFRWIRKEEIKYGLVGLIMLVIAGILTILTNNPNTYFLPDMITNTLIVISIIVTTFLKMPFAAYASHLTRSWPLEWYWREDIKPAYLEVSIIWGILFSLKLVIQIINLFGSNLNIGIINLLLGFPFTLTIMSVSYIYGIMRLKSLHGPSVDEFKMNKDKPYVGQTKGF